MRLSLLMIVAFSIGQFVSAAENCSTSSSEVQVQEQMTINTDIPSHLKGATICVKRSDGKETCVPAEKFKVVARKQQFIVTKTSQKDVTTCSAEREKNRINLLAGQGPKGTLAVSKTISKVEVESRVGVIGGIQYQRLITDKVNLSIQGQTNDSALIGIGLDF